MGIAMGRILPSRYFSWAPFEETSFYEIHAELGGRALEAEAILDRWGMAQSGRNNRSIHNVISVVRWCEKRSNDQMEVRLRFWTNGGEEQVWEWPEDTISFTK